MHGVRHVGDAERVPSRVEPSPARRLSIRFLDVECRVARAFRSRVAENNNFGLDERAVVVNLPRAHRAVMGLVRSIGMFSVVRRKGLEIAEWEMRQLGELAESGEDGDEVGAGEPTEVESGAPAWAPADALGLRADGRRRDEDDEDEDDEDPDFAFDELDEDKELGDEEADLDDYDDEDDSDEEASEDEEH